MKLEDQVCSLELGIKLKKLGVIMPSIFYYEWTGATEVESWENNKPDWCEDNISVYTVAELGEMLPDGANTSKSTKYNWWYCEVPKKYNQPSNAEKTEADARAKMLIYLIENKLIAPPSSL